MKHRTLLQILVELMVKNIALHLLKGQLRQLEHLFLYLYILFLHLN